MKRIALAGLLAMGFAFAEAQGPNNTGTYYQGANGKQGEALKTALYSIISPHTDIGYDGLREAYKKTDVREDGYLRDWYSNITSYVPGSAYGSYSKEGDAYNREHLVPQSWFGSGVVKADIVHVVPSDGYVNNRRANYPLAEVSKADWSSANQYCKLGSCRTDGYSGKVFEPNDEVKGDIARIYFYMATCYEDRCTSWGNGVFSSDKYAGLESWVMSMMMRWSRQDPVDAVEKARNEAVYQVQHNRNPFVDYPGLENYVWGTKKDMAFSYDNYEGGGDDPVIEVVSMPKFSPAGGTFTDFVEVTMTTATAGAIIYYTTDGSNATEQSLPYEGPIALTATTTLKAVAVKDGQTSAQAQATYVIRTGGDAPVEEGVIALNNSFFGVPGISGSLPKGDNSDDFIGHQDNITVVYAVGTGKYRYLNDSQIRLYPGNTLEFAVDNGKLTEVQFELATTSSNRLLADNGTIDNLTWVGNDERVQFSVDGNSGHLRLVSARIKITDTMGIERQVVIGAHSTIVHSLTGLRLSGQHLRPGIYVVGGKKIMVR